MHRRVRGLLRKDSLEATPSPILLRCSTELPSPARGEGANLPYSSGSTFTSEAPWLLPVQNVTGVVELSTNTRLILVLRGNR